MCSTEGNAREKGGTVNAKTISSVIRCGLAATFESRTTASFVYPDIAFYTSLNAFFGLDRPRNHG